MSTASGQSSQDTVRVALVQTAAVAFDLEASLKKLEGFTKTAANNGAQLVLFPEAFLSGYPRGSAFGAGNDFYGDIDCAKIGREKYRVYWESSIDVPGPVTEHLATIAKTYNIFLVVGVIERESGTMYCTVVHFDNNGNFLGKHRKIVPTFHERLYWSRGDGSTLPVFDTTLGKLGSVICWENYMPLLRMHMYNQGIQIYCAPTADWGDEWVCTMRHIAMEGRCFVLACCQFSRKSDFPADYIDAGFEQLSDGSLKEGNYVIVHGGSCVICPSGKVIAGPIYDEEVVLYADLDMRDIVRGKTDMDVVGHYSRPDIFQLSVNRTAQKNVVYFETTNTT